MRLVSYSKAWASDNSGPDLSPNLVVLTFGIDKMYFPLKAYVV